MLRIAGIIIIVLSYLIAAVVDTKYKVKLSPAYWYLWGVLSTTVGLTFMFL